jgi:RHS repeat-associated protein
VRRFVTAPTLADGLESPYLVTDGSGGVQTGYVYAGEMPLLRFDANGQPVYYLEDALQSVAALADSTGQKVGDVRYDGFGNVRSATGPQASVPSGSGGDWRFHGEWLENATGMYHLRAREYDPRTGRFVSRDPVEGVVEAPETLHPYAFAGSNPHTQSDPTGLFSVASISLGVNFQSQLQSARAATINEVRQEIAGRISNFAMDLMARSLRQFIGLSNPEGYMNLLNGDGTKIGGIRFENIIARALCDVVGGGSTEGLWFTPALNEARGQVLQDGVNCNTRNADNFTSNYRGGLSINGVKVRYPDFLFKRGRPSDLSSRTQLVGDVKASISTMYDDYFGKNRGKKEGQFNAIVRHSYTRGNRVSLFVTFWRTKGYAEQIRANVQEKLMQAQSIRRGGWIFIVSIVP